MNKNLKKSRKLTYKPSSQL